MAATIKDIARELNMGVSTVSMALNDHPKISKKTKKLVLNKAKELNYIRNGIAVDLQKQRKNVILLILDDASRPYFSRVINAVQKQIVEYDYDLLILTTFKGHDKTARRYISEHRADGAIVFTMNIEDEFIRTYASIDFPICVLGRKVEGDSIYSVGAFTRYVGYSATEYLIKKGHRRIAFVRADLKTLGTVRRFEGYQKALNDYGIEYNEQLIFDAKGSEYSNGYNVTEEIIVKINEIDAVFYANDDIAIAGLRAFKDAGITVPNDVSVISYNDLPSAELVTPKLTSVSTNESELSKLAVDILMSAIAKKDELKVREELELARIKILQDTIIERETVLKKE